MVKITHDMLTRTYHSAKAYAGIRVAVYVEDDFGRSRLVGDDHDVIVASTMVRALSEHAAYVDRVLKGLESSDYTGKTTIELREDPSANEPSLFPDIYE
jgi:hypothetical protein